MTTNESDWSEQDYLAYLRHERHMYAWCLHAYGNIPQEEADRLAAAFYEYEPPSKCLRGLVFHDEAWHWAMLKIFGGLYWKSHPELGNVSKEYEKESEKYKARQALSTEPASPRPD